MVGRPCSDVWTSADMQGQDVDIRYGERVLCFSRGMRVQI